MILGASGCAIFQGRPKMDFVFPCPNLPKQRSLVRVVRVVRGELGGLRLQGKKGLMNGDWPGAVGDVGDVGFYLHVARKVF